MSSEVYVNAKYLMATDSLGWTQPSVVFRVLLVFTTPLKFLASGPSKESFYVNGVLQLQGVGNDYTVSESGGPGTGYGTITMAYPPLSFDRLSVDFVPS